MDISALGQQNGGSVCLTVAYCFMQGGVALHQAGCRMFWVLTLAGRVGSEWYLGKDTGSCSHAAWQQDSGMRPWQAVVGHAEGPAGRTCSWQGCEGARGIRGDSRDMPAVKLTILYGIGQCTDHKWLPVKQ